MAQYKCIPAPTTLVIDSKSNMEKAVNSFANIINENAVDGWEFQSLENIAVTQKPGCLGELFGGKPFTMHFNMLIFVKK